MNALILLLGVRPSLIVKALMMEASRINAGFSFQRIGSVMGREVSAAVDASPT
jgi:hypothetical protein